MTEDYTTPPDLQERLDRDTNKHIDRDRKIKEAEGLEGQEKIDKLKEGAGTRLRGEELMDNLISKIELGARTVAETAAKDDPDSYWDEAARFGLGTAQFVGTVAGAPGISHVLRLLDSPFWAARQTAGGVLEHGFGVDPRYGHAAVGIGELFVGGKALTGVAKKAKHVHQMSGLSRAYKKGTQFIPDTAILPRQRELGVQLMAKIDNTTPPPMWGPPNPQRTKNLKVFEDFKSGLSADEVAEEIVKLEGKYRGAALQNPGGPLRGGTIRSDITGRVSGSPSTTRLGDDISPIRYTPKDFTMDDPNSIAGFIRGVGAKLKSGSFNFEDHHIASLAEYKRALTNLSGAERQLGYAYLIEKGIFLGNNPFNRAVIPKPVHQGVSNWISKNIRQYLKDKYPNLESLPLEERWKIFDELAELTKKSEEEMFRLVQQYNASIQGAPGNPSGNVIVELFEDANLENLKWFQEGMKKGAFDFKGAGIDEKGWNLRQEIRKRQGPFGSKRDDLNPPGKGKSTPKSG